MRARQLLLILDALADDTRFEKVLPWAVDDSMWPAECTEAPVNQREGAALKLRTGLVVFGGSALAAGIAAFFRSSAVAGFSSNSS